ncbi:glycosyl hydrolase [Sphingomonas ginkgonis]|uniref:Glycosyl hydrolase n=1 Tax=Sphingomonas ginkgonis TaxID=2315330 RepID=A0A3R9Y4V4_9SPHN|nr:glycoside hydrolase family 3 C-terminal domain-containing protein [Sphingomonas ginkgonis]RST30216.1 glycosyl hydrolase [Sphingomonas ginkgonis]
MLFGRLLGTMSAAVLALAAGQAGAAPRAAAGPDQRAAALVGRMSEDEKLQLVFGYFATDFAPKNYVAKPGGRDGSAGYVPGIARLGVPAQWQTDAGVGVATQGAAKQKRERTALPSGLATAASWNPDVGYAGGRMIGAEAFSSGFNTMLAGGANLLRDPRNGRNFEYGGEDPLLAGTMVGAQIAGIQSNHVISTLKHYAMNDLETGRDYHDAVIAQDAARISDLLAFQFAAERGNPGSVMCSYNQVNGAHSCENRWLLTDMLRGQFGWPGFVMSDWGATHSTEAAANAGLDQDSGFPFDKEPYFGAPLKAAVDSGRVPRARLDEMARRVVRSMIAVGLLDHPVAVGPIDYAAHALVTRTDAEEGSVLLKNEGNLLPLGPAVRRIVLIGSHADRGVLSGGGSSQVYPVGGNAVPGLEPTGWPGPVVYFPSSPLAELQRLAPNAQIRFVDGSDPAAAAAAARSADVAIVFLNQWTSESIDTPIALPGNQDALVEAVAGAQPRTVAVLETGGPVLMPWAARVPAILETWYPGSAGGAAIARLLTGAANPSGKLPATFPMSEAQLPRPVRPGTGLKDGEMFSIRYDEGATVGYKWFDARNLQPLFPFGHGLSYTSFAYTGLTARPAGGAIEASVTVRNTGRRAGKEVVQLYVSPQRGGWEAPRRLAAFEKVSLAPGQSRRVTLRVDPRLLATYAGGQWSIAPGAYDVLAASSSRDFRSRASVTLAAATLPGNWRP